RAHPRDPGRGRRAGAPADAPAGGGGAVLPHGVAVRRAAARARHPHGRRRADRTDSAGGAREGRIRGNAHGNSGHRAEGALVVRRLADVVARGVRVTAGGVAGSPASEISAETFEQGVARATARFDTPADVPDFAAVYGEAQVPAPVRGHGIDKMAEILE